MKKKSTFSYFIHEFNFREVKNCDIADFQILHFVHV